MNSWSAYSAMVPGSTLATKWAGADYGRYKNEYQYDADGNILKQIRSGRLGGNEQVLDDMTYSYSADADNDNRLQNVSDVDHWDKGPYNYEQGADYNGFTYDVSGRLIVDHKEGLNVDWYPFDKPKSVSKMVQNANGDQVLSTTAYKYDALHNRVEKNTDDVKKTAYIRYASDNIMAVYEFGLGKGGNYAWVWTEQHLYGAERTSTTLSDHLGVHQVKEDWLAALNPVIEPQNPHFVGHNRAFKGRKNYELTNHTSTTLSDHLGNVMAVVSDKLTKYSVVEAGVIPYSLPNMVSATDYDPFGMALEQRAWQHGGVEEYGFSFNTQLESPEIGDGHTTAMYWEYDARIGRRWELDPKTVTGWSGYACLGDSPIGLSDVLGDKAEGEFERDKTTRRWVKTSTKGDDIGVDFYHKDPVSTTIVDINSDTGVKTSRVEITQTTLMFDSQGNMNIMKNGKKNLSGTVRQDNIGWREIFREWREETGPSRSLFMGDQPCNAKIHNSVVFKREVIDKIIKSKSSKKKGSIDLKFNTELIESGMQIQMMGSFKASYYMFGSRMLFVVSDSKTRSSFFYHLPFVSNVERKPDAPQSEQPGQATTHQTYIFWYGTLTNPYD
jgi:hypothetical protein